MSLKTCLMLGVITLTALSGCGPSKDLSYPRTQADEKFISFLTNDYGLKPVVQTVHETLWAYIPLDHVQMYKIVPTQKSPPIKKKFTQLYVDGLFDHPSFMLDHDVVTTTVIAADAGLATKATEEFSRINQNVMTAVSRAYSAAEDAPVFLVLILADIQNGIVNEQTICLADLKKFYAGALPSDEYSLRMLNDVKGNPDIVGDKTGRSLQPQAVSWPDFLIRQIKQRIRFKFQQSDFPPQETPEGEILKQIALTLHAYDFNDYQQVILRDLRQGGAATTFSLEDIAALKDPNAKTQKPPSQSRIMTIDFSEIFKGLRSEQEPKD